MASKFTTHHGTTADDNGCEFSYTCYTEKERVLNPDTLRFQWSIIRRDYVSPVCHATSLQALKNRMASHGRQS